jgi:hypothetical protein
MIRRYKMKHLVVIYDIVTDKTLKEYEVEAEDWYFARHIGQKRFQDECPEMVRKHDWKVDSMEI